MKRPIIICAVACLITMTACSKSNVSDNNNNDYDNKVMEAVNETEINSEAVSETEVAPYKYINEAGMTMESRINTPQGYSRVQGEEGSLTSFLRNYPLLEYGAPVLLYDGSKKGRQNDHVSVFDLPIEEYDLQQCADSIMRVYAEYYWSTGQYDRIAFHFVDGFLAEYTKWRDGYRISVDGNNVSWVHSKSYDDSYECFVNYMKIVFSYAGTLSMNEEATETSLDKLKVGDIFIKGGSPGHVVMVVDMCENEAGEKAFLLAQGYMPAQQFHILKNDRHEDDPWYYEHEVEYPFDTPEYTFGEGSLKALSY